MSDFDDLRDSYRSAVAFREAMVRLSLSAAGSRLLTEKIRAATQAVAQARAALDRREQRWFVRSDGWSVPIDRDAGR